MLRCFLKIMEENHFGKLVAHAPYTLNPCSADPHLREFARETLRDDLHRMEYLPGKLLQFSSGQPWGQGAETGIQEIAEALNEILWPEQQTTVLLETMAGKGSEVGRELFRAAGDSRPGRAAG